MATQKERLEQFKKVQEEGFRLFNKKNTDYGDAFADYGVVGILVRMNDKVRRYMSIKNNGISLVNDESLRDTLIDLHNYSAMAIMLMDEEKESSNKILCESCRFNLSVCGNSKKTSCDEYELKDSVTRSEK